MKRRRHFLNILMLPICLLLVWWAIRSSYNDSLRDAENLSEPTGPGDVSRKTRGKETVYMSRRGTNGESFPGGPSQSGHGVQESNRLAKLSRNDGRSEARINHVVVGKLSPLVALLAGADKSKAAIKQAEQMGRNTLGNVSELTQISGSFRPGAAPTHAENVSSIAPGTLTKQAQSGSVKASNTVSNPTNYGIANLTRPALNAHQETGTFPRLTVEADRGAGRNTATDKLFSPYIRSYNESKICRELKDRGRYKLQLTPNTKLILYWHELGNDEKRLGGFRKMCPFPTHGPCEITWDESYQPRADAVVFHASRLVSEEPPFRKLPGQVWVARALESPTHWHKAYRSAQWKGVFNWTFSYRPDSELFSPVGTLVKVPDRPQVDYRRIARSKKRSVAWFVSDCNTESKREKYVREMKKYIDVDIYGECGNLKCSKDEKKDCFELLSETYRFYLAFENSLCDHYITEKFFNKFGKIGHPQYIIPVVRGGTNYRKYFPEGTFIDAADFESPKALASYLNEFRRDDDAYAALIARKDRYGVVSCFRNVAWCKLCNMLHDKNIKPKVYTDLGAWWDQEACVEPKDI